MLIFRPPADVPASDSVALDCPPGAAYSGDKLIAYSIGGHIRLAGLVEGADVTCVALDSLTLHRLQALVSFLDVDTSAQTAAGLRRAIERHLGVG